MTITPEQVADLQPGDVVEFRLDEWPEHYAIRSMLRINQRGALVASIPGNSAASYRIRDAHGRPFDQTLRTLTILSRTPRPLYVNHPRTEPVPGDVVRVEFDTGCDDDWCMNAYAPVDDDSGLPPWLSIAKVDAGCRYTADMVIPTPGSRGQMRLLVDGETGQVVP